MGAVVAEARAGYTIRMVVRLLLALILAAFALPAAAMPCHDAPMAGMAAMAHHPDSPRDKALPVHACIGCVPPSSWRSGAVPPRLAAPATIRAARIATLDLAPVAPPATPPPKPAA